ncbi:hypothetical protein [Brevibacillus sp. NRS-1366]|uniref:hypothetical protein n=1 Tax=Brevibacillus sp. NRS-1366 TaxID=3233899 RepID=UPI003D1FF4D9
MQVRTLLAAIFAVFVAFSFLFHPLPASACSCAPPPDPQTAKDQAAAVFTGKVIQVSERSDWRKWIPFGNRPSRDGFDVVLEVQSAWKGVDHTRVLITTSGFGGSCGVPFQIGTEHLIYAYYWESDELETNICTRTTPLINASEDLQVLGPGSVPSNSSGIMWTQQFSMYSVIGAIFLAGTATFFLLSSKKRRR